MSLHIYEVDQGSDEWFRLRENKITGSNVYHWLKTGSTRPNKASAGGYWAERGITLEVDAIELYEALYGVKIQRPGFITNIKYPNAGCSPDGIVEKTLIEIKAFKDKKHLKSKEDIPPEVMAQIQFNMMICESELAHLLLYNPDISENEFIKVEIYPDEKITNHIKEKLNED